MFSIWKPAKYQGTNQTENYFEGWYYKFISSDEKLAFAVIAGVAYEEDSRHAFIQIYNDSTEKHLYFSEEIDNFKYSPDDFIIHIGASSFSLNHMHLDIQKENNRITAEFQFNNIIPWPIKWYSPGAMGWYAFIPFMEDFHGILSLNHTIKGSLNVNNDLYIFDEGKGYIEKDWGRSSPKAWIWLQSNNFPEKDVSLTVSIATIPWFTNLFTGFIIGLLYKDELFKFCTYTGANIKKILTTSKEVEINVENRNHTLRIHAKKTSTSMFHIHERNRNRGKMNENLRSYVEIELYEKTKDAPLLIYKGKGRRAGLEINGDLIKLSEGISV